MVCSFWGCGRFADRKGIVRIIGLQPQNVEDVVKKLLAEPAP